MKAGVFFKLVVIAGVVCAAAQNASDPQPGTRAARIEAERQKKATELQPDNPGIAERIVARVSEGIFTNIAHIPGFSVKLGGMVTGSGFALGPQYERAFLDEHLLMMGHAAVSTRKWELAEFGLHYGRLPGDHFFANLDSAYRNFNSLNYYGSGPNTFKSGRTDYRLESVNADATVGIRPVAPLEVGFQSGVAAVNVGPGQDDTYASTDAVYPPAAAPGIDRQTMFVRAGPVASFDYLDSDRLPRSGGLYMARYLWYHDQQLNRYSFRRSTAEVQQYVPLFHKTHVLAFRIRTAFSTADSGQIVPFYMQPVLGGDDLRGFRPFRFYGNNMEVANAEYRWNVFSGLDLAAFYDTGKVFQNTGDWTPSHLEHSVGFGVRFSTPSAMAMRIDTGFSREGFQILVKFDNVWTSVDNRGRGW